MKEANCQLDFFEYEPHYMCEKSWLKNGEVVDCPNRAVSEWVDGSEYDDPTESSPHTYMTFRCADHPVNDRNYEERPL